jgi:1-phosphofructokinase
MSVRFAAGEAVVSGDVMVYAPSPVLTVTLEQHSGAPSLHLHAGGQGVWQARMLAGLGADAVLCTTLGGEVGRVLSGLLAVEDFTVRAVHRSPSSGWYIHDRSDGERRELAGNPGDPLDRHQIDDLYNLALGEGLRAGVSVFAGPTDPGLVPPDTYRRLAADLRANDATVIADLTGDHLAAALQGGISVLKVSHDELVAAGRAADESLPALRTAAHQLRADGAAAVVISRAEQPAIALLDDAPIEVEAPTLEMADPRGAGDSMTAAVAASLARGAGLDEAVRVGAAAGAVNVTRHGLGTGQAEAIAELAKRVRLVPVLEDGPGERA